MLDAQQGTQDHRRCIESVSTFKKIYRRSCRRACVDFTAAGQLMPSRLCLPMPSVLWHMRVLNRSWAFTESKRIRDVGDS